MTVVNPLKANPTKWSNTLKQFVGNLPTSYLSVFDHFVGLAFKGLKPIQERLSPTCCSLRKWYANLKVHSFSFFAFQVLVRQMQRRD